MSVYPIVLELKFELAVHVIILLVLQLLIAMRMGPLITYP